MIAYLVPVGGRRYQLYVEAPAEDPDAAAAPAEGAGWWSRQVHKFRTTLAEAEQERLRRERGEPGRGSGLWQAVLRRMAEAIAEQRLLWHLRHQSSAEVMHPDDLDGATALAEVRAEFTRDVSKHLRWLIINVVIVAVTGPLLFLVPGPNLVSWYFTFRAIGHFFSWRGARRGLRDVAWRTTASTSLTQVRAALQLPARDRRTQLIAIGEALELRHLAGFVERVAVRAK